MALDLLDQYTIFLIAIVMVFFFVKKEKEHHKLHCDWMGIGLLALIIGSLILGIMQGPHGDGVLILS